MPESEVSFLDEIFNKTKKIVEDLKEMNYLEASVVLKTAQEIIALNAVVEKNKLLSKNKSITIS